MWNIIKKAFAWGFGGRLGWELGGVVANLIGRVVRWLVAGGLAYGSVYGLAHMPDLPNTHKPVAGVHQQK